MAQQHLPDRGTDPSAYFLSREYEDYLDWLENHRLPTDGVELGPKQQASWGGRCRAYFGAILAGLTGVVARLF